MADSSSSIFSTLKKHDFSTNQSASYICELYYNHLQ